MPIHHGKHINLCGSYLCSTVECMYSGMPEEVLVSKHYENMPMQYTEIFKVVKNDNFQY